MREPRGKPWAFAFGERCASLGNRNEVYPEGREYEIPEHYLE